MKIMGKYTLKDERPEPPRKGPDCSVQTAKSLLDAKGNEVLEKWLDDPSIAATQIMRKLNEAIPDVKVGHGAVLRHRRGECECRR
jgi:hypothetical protein